jgi:hypothetical protein
VIPLDELDTFRADLTTTLRLYQRTPAADLGEPALREFAEKLDTRREGYDDALSGDSAKALLQAGREAIITLNLNMEKLAGLLRDLGSLVAAFQRPTLSGGLSGMSDDLTVLNTRLDVVKRSIEQLMKEVNTTQAVLSRLPGRSGKNQTPPQGRSYWSGPMAVGAEYRR